ncbi:MAG: hypothetical protein IJV93_11375 [Lentisphaeria bacterium]|nr:hypothetical protein [Lentisphaeria bacterium]
MKGDLKTLFQWSKCPTIGDPVKKERFYRQQNEGYSPLVTALFRFLTAFE